MAKGKNKGKVHPSPAPSSPSSPSSVLVSSSLSKDAVSVLNLLPATILSLAMILSFQDREVLAYMISWSINSSSSVNDSKIKCKKPSQTRNCNNNGGGGGGSVHMPPLFHCDCFECYTYYWHIWNSSPDRENIHQAIEAFEDHLSHSEYFKLSIRKDKLSLRLSEIPAGTSETPSMKIEINHSGTLSSPEKNEAVNEIEPEVEDTSEEFIRTAAKNQHSHKGFGRKVIPDVLGLFNARLWNLWSPTT